MSIKCPICNDKFNELEDVYGHITEEHDESIPKNYVVSQYYYALKTGKEIGSCVICKNPTPWNIVTNKYNRFCNVPQRKCKIKYRKIFEERMIGKFGKVHLLSSPDHQKKMLANRKISGEYTWGDGSLKTYTGSYELDFLRLLDVLMEFDSDDVMSPSPHTYYYEYEGETKFYIPDLFIASLGVEIEIKTGEDNPNMHGKIQSVDKVKEKLKDGVLMSQREFSYIKILNKNYEPFFEFLMKKKQEFIKSTNGESNSPIFIVRENIEIMLDESQHVVLENTKVSNEPLYFYHLLGKDIKLTNHGLLSPEGMYRLNKLDLFDSAISKYSNRMVNGWGIYPGRKPESLSRQEMIDGLKNFRADDDALNAIYFFRYPPYFGMGKNMDMLLKNKKLIRIDLNAPRVKSIIKSIHWGHDGSFTGNKKLTRQWYEKITSSEYFSKYDDTTMPLFASLNHISISTKEGYIPLDCIEEIPISNYLPLNLTDDFKAFTKTIKTPNDLSEWMQKNINYGYITKTGETKPFGEDSDENEFIRDYKLQSPEELLHSKTGVCWEQAEFERYFFKNIFKIKYEVIYIVQDKTPYYPTHTLLLFWKGNDIYWFENSYYDHRGIHGPYNNREEVVELIRGYMVKSNGPDKGYTATIMETPKYGIGFHEYMNFAEKQRYITVKESSSNHIETISFPENEYSDIKERLDSNKYVYTIRVDKEYGKYTLNSLYETPFGYTIKIIEISNITNIKEYVFYDTLDIDQINLLKKYNKLQVIKFKLFNPSEDKEVLTTAKDIVVNFDTWKKNKNKNILFITGLSGSGKSTLARKYSDRYNAKIIALDGFEHDFDYSGTNVLTKFKKEYPEYTTYFKKHWKNTDTKFFMGALDKFMLFLINELDSNNKNLYIVEGVQLIDTYYIDLLRSKPLIIIGTGAIQSYMNRVKRTLNSSDDGGMVHSIPQLIRAKKYLDTFKKGIMESGVTESVNFEVKDSTISGRGIFAKLDIKKGVNLGLAFKKIDTTGKPDRDYKRTSLGAFVNHSNNPNLIVTIIDNKYYYHTNKDIGHGDELTIDYGKFNFEGERSFITKESTEILEEN